MAINNLGDVTFTSQPDPSFSASATRSIPVPPLEDQVQISTIPSTAQVELVQITNPSSFQAVVGEAIQKLRTAASRSTDPVETAYLSGLADRFQRLEEAGYASASTGPAQSPAS
jgi:hypothetical protein